MHPTDLKQTRAAGYLGLAMRSGQLTLGGDMVLRQIRAGQAALVLIDQAASGNTLKKLTDACAYHHVPFLMVEEGLLSSSSGKGDRVAGCLKKGGLAEKVRELLSPEGEKAPWTKAEQGPETGPEQPSKESNHV